MKYLLDADWIISFLNARRKAIELIEELADDGIVLSVITYGEVYEGLLRLAATAPELAQLDIFSARVNLIPPDIEIAREYARIRSDLRSQGLLIPDNDLWIAATAIVYDLTLVSRDHHFDRIPGVRLYRA